MSNTRIAFIGAGNMAASLIGGLRAKGLDAAQIRASDPGADTRARVSAEHGIETFADNAEAIRGVDVIVLAVKPQAMKALCESLRPSLQPQQLVVSIAAGITCASMKNWLGAQPIVRCMPNTPALVSQGVSGLYATSEVSAEQRDQAQELLSAVGIALWLAQRVAPIASAQGEFIGQHPEARLPGRGLVLDLRFQLAARGETTVFRGFQLL